MPYTYEQSIEDSTRYFNGNDLSAKVFVDKYALRNKEGEILESNPEQMHRRLAKEFARIEKQKFKNPLTEDEIFSYLDRFKYIIPQGSPMYGIGNPYQIVSLSNCYVVDLYDSYGGICLTDQYITQISKRRGGIGYDISCLRPKDLPVSNAARTTTGAVSFMHRFSNTGREVGQCIEQNQRVLTSNGLKKIKDINPTEMVWTKDGWVQVVNTFNNGKKKVYKVTTDTGYSIISSIDHIYQTFNNQGKLTEIPLSKLEAGDKIVLCVGEGSHHSNYIKLEDPKYKNFNRKPANCILPEILDEKLAYILGYSYGDGYVEHDEYGEYGICLACSNDYPDIKEQLLSYIYNVFGYTSNLGAGDGDLERLRISNKTIVQFLKHNCLLKEKSGTISFPSKIIDSTISVQTAFIAGYFDADGYNGGKKTGYVFSSINKLFLKNIQILLSTYGILSKISSLDRSDEGWNTLYKLCVVGNASTSRFVDLFKTASVKVGLEQYISKRECWLTPFKPRSFDVKYNNHSFCPDNTQFLSLSVVNKLKSEYNTVTTLVQDNISSIEYIGEEDTYDLQLESEHLFWCEGFYVHNSGRRAAQMITISVHHPDIMDFITVKNDEISVTGANISVRLSDEFLNAVKSNEEYQLRWPVDVDNPQITRMVSARDVWKLIIHNAWLRAEPGLLMWDSIIRESPSDCYAEFGFKTISTNPCQPSWAKVLTRGGIRQFSQVNIGDEIWSKNGWTKITNKWSSGVKNVYKYTTTAGIFYGTENHKVVSNGTKIEAGLTDSIDVITGEYHSNITIDNNIVMDGIVFGDGSVHKASNNLVYLCIGKDDQDYFTSEISNLIIKYRPGLSDEAYEVKTSIQPHELPKTYERVIPNRYLYGNRDTVCSFLRGLYSANGSVCGNRITLKTSSPYVVECVQMMLSSVGILSYYTTNKPSQVKFSNGEYLCKQSYDINIAADREKFVNLIGFIQEYKNNKIKILKIPSRKKSTYDIISVDLISEEEVFDITVDNNSHTYWTQCCNVSNCSEIPLSAFDSCRLLALNLFNFVKNPFSKNAEYDFSLFKKYAGIAQRLMDDIVDLELECINRIITKIENDPEPEFVKIAELTLWKNIKTACENGRRTGTGITALGDTLAGMGIKYGSKNSIEFVDQLFKTLKLGSYRSSVDMAKELGSFPIWNHSLEKNNPFLLRIKDDDEELWSDMKKYGRRNIACLTSAPTGTISTQACLFVDDKYYFNTSSGIEPVFTDKPYIRRKKINHSDKSAKIDYIDKLGDKWSEFKVYHSGITAWMDTNEKDSENDSPYSGATAEEINWQNRVKLQAAAQQHIDHAISSTINLPNDVEEKEVAKIYETAWQNGCKGITVYRDGCRSGVLVKESGPKITKTIAPERPKDLTCDVFHVIVKGKPYFVLVGLFEDGSPYEVFAGKNGHIDPKVKKGIITRKLKPKCYKAVLEDDTEISPVTIACDENEEALTRMVSTALRHGAETKFIHEQLLKVQGDMNIFAKALARALKHYIANGDASDEKCPTCECVLTYQEGCKSCSSCGFSKCS